MSQATPIAYIDSSHGTPDVTGILAGYRFRVCTTDGDARRALAVRRRVYVDEKGLPVSVPDEYDRRSWVVIAEEAASGVAVGSIRLTPRAAGPLESELSFLLPSTLRTHDVVEFSRLSILREHRRGQGRSPAVILGLFKTITRFAVDVVKARRVVVCSKAERVWTYTWLRFQQTGVRAPYAALGGEPHEILFLDLRHGFEPYRDHEIIGFFADLESPEITMPSEPPPLGLGVVDAPLLAASA